ncbi:hypothetical protein G7085_07355 [Tessaracoccus sp. HDW20]|uniref:hypothetical protein n=1 Tax=Tessaracoccus coleopterorum TaxID=2714950 RepID=UPI0018D3C27D|nr:hypothetical protein [Tessaracoccus coleopterorum]NHB84487.1 hypothetical protein [Tessaracoccus coleopterorum]
MAQQVEHLDSWLRARRLAAVSAELENRRPVTARLEAEVGAAANAAEAAEVERRRCQQAVDNSGGGDLTVLEDLRRAHLADRDRARGDRDTFASAAGRLTLVPPATADDVGRFEEELAGAREELVSRQEAFDAAQGGCCRSWAMREER